MLDVQRITTGPMQANCYVVSAPGGDAVVIDPGDQFELIDTAIAARAVEIRAVLCTHAHFDHLGAVAALVEKYGASFHLHEGDAPLLRRVNLYRALVHGEKPIPIPIVDVSIDDGTLLRFGALEAQVVHTPGHSPGSVCFEIADELFTGDTIVSGHVGRTDLPGGNRQALEASIHRLAERFSPQTVLRPGHGEPIPLKEILSMGGDLPELRDQALIEP